jgi:hypothetical protein
VNLGHLIDTFKLHKATAEVVISAPLPIIPGSLDSYRGYYEQLAIEPEMGGDGKKVTVEEFLKRLEEAVGATFTGYKGGEFTMDRDTPIWIAEYSMSSPWSCRVTGVTNLYDAYARIDWRKDD